MFLFGLLRLELLFAPVPRRREIVTEGAARIDRRPRCTANDLICRGFENSALCIGARVDSKDVSTGRDGRNWRFDGRVRWRELNAKAATNPPSFFDASQLFSGFFRA